VFPSPRLFSSPIICERRQRKPECTFEDGQRFGLHNLRHSLSNWLVNKAKVEPKTVQGILRHAKIQTTLDLYAAGRRR
jgi:integrase